jgi:chromosome segregation ATPase
MKGELAKVNADIQFLTAGQKTLAGQFAVASAELADLRKLIGRSDQRGTIFLQQLEQSEAGLQELRKSITEHASRWERNLNTQKAMSSGAEHRCAQISGRLESMEPRVADTQVRVEELTRLHLSTHQQVSSLSMQVREILGSRIWQALVKGGGIVLRLTGRGK